MRLSMPDKSSVADHHRPSGIYFRKQGIHTSNDSFGAWSERALVGRTRRPQQGGGGQRRGLYVEGNIEEGVMRGGGVAARAAHDVRLQQATKDALQCAIPLFCACHNHTQM